MERPTISRRSFNLSALASAIAAMATNSLDAEAGAQWDAASNESTRREVIKQLLPEIPPREITLIEVTYPPGAASPPHAHANGVMAFVLEGEVVSKVGDQPARTFHAGEAWWESQGAIHRISRNPSSSKAARLLAIYIAPLGATPEDLMKPI